MGARSTTRPDHVAQDPTTSIEMFDRRLLQAPHEDFLIELSGRTLTYAQVAAAAEALAGGLDRLGARPGDVAGVYMSNHAGWIVASLGCWSRGLTVASVNRLIPPESAAEELELSHVRLVCVTSDDDDVGGGDMARFDLLSLETDVKAGTPSPGQLHELSDHADAVIVFTSGTTGRPKALRSSHARLMEAARQQAASYASSPEFRGSVAPGSVAPIVSFTAYGHLAGYTSLAFALWTGRRFALVDKFSVEAARVLVERYHLSALRLNPAAILMLATAEEDLDLTNLRYVYSGTAPLSAKTRDLFTQRYGVPILQGYGQSETGPIALSRYDDVVSGREPPGSVGRVLDDVVLRVADADDLALPCSAEGEIQVKTNQSAAASDEATLSVTADGYIRTGDIGWVDSDGYLRITGRLTDKMVVGGFNVFPAEVEDAVRRSDLVRDAVVVGVPDDRLGERPVAGVLWTDRPDHDSLAQFVRSKLAAYKVPRQWCDLDEIPLTDRGKVDRREALSLIQSLLEAE